MHNPAARLDRAAGELAVAFFDALESRQLLTNVAPTLASAFVAPSTLPFLGRAVTITAINAADSDGSIAQVRFFYDSNGDGVLQPDPALPNADLLIGIDNFAAGGWNLNVAAQAGLGFQVGVNRVFAQAVDNQGGTVARAVTLTITAANAGPVVGSLVAPATPIVRGSTATFTASGFIDADGTATAVEFYLRSVGDTFDAAANYALGNYPSSVAVGDFNGDGRPDLAVVKAFDSNVAILLGNAGGTFDGPANFPTGLNPQFVEVGDFNGDGQPDLAVLNRDGDSISILLGNGNGTFDPKVDYAVGDSQPR